MPRKKRKTPKPKAEGREPPAIPDAVVRDVIAKLKAGGTSLAKERDRVSAALKATIPNPEAQYHALHRAIVAVLGGSVRSAVPKRARQKKGATP